MLLEGKFCRIEPEFLDHIMLHTNSFVGPPENENDSRKALRIHGENGALSLFCGGYSDLCLCTIF